MGVRHMLERRLELNGGLMTADLGVLRPDGGGQILEAPSAWRVCFPSAGWRWSWSCWKGTPAGAYG